MAKRKLKPRPMYREHSEAAINFAIRNAIHLGDTFWDFLTEERLAENFGTSEFERGVIEGARRFAGRLQDIIMSDDHETNV
jgi:hypothetical protein